MWKMFLEDFCIEFTRDIRNVEFYSFLGISKKKKSKEKDTIFNFHSRKNSDIVCISWHQCRTLRMPMEITLLFWSTLSGMIFMFSKNLSLFQKYTENLTSLYTQFMGELHPKPKIEHVLCAISKWSTFFGKIM